MSMMLGGRGLASEMNVTPMVDVLLVLVIIFLITPRKDPPHGLEGQVPQPAVQASATPETTIVLQIRRGVGDTITLHLNQEAVTWNDLPRRLRDIYKARATKVMFIRGDGDIEFAHVAHAMDLTRAADPAIAIGLMGKHSIGD